MDTEVEETRPVPWLALLALLALGAALRAWDLGGPSLSGDEAGCIYFGSFPLNTLVEAILASQEVHPPGFFAFIHFWRLLGWQEGVLRLPSVLFGLATLAGTYWALRAMEGLGRTNQGVALMATGLMTLSTYHIQASRELRMYSLLTLLVVLGLGCLARWMATEKLAWLGGYSLVLALGYWNHYLSFFALPLGLLWVLVCRPRWWWRWGAAVAVSGLPLLPWLPYLFKQVGGQDLMIRPAPRPLDFLETLGRMAGGDVGPAGSFWFMVLGVLVVLATGVVLAASRREGMNQAVVLAFLWMYTPLVLLFLLSAFTPMRLFEFKYFVWSAPALFWLVSHLVVGLPRAGQAVIVVALVAMNLASYSVVVVRGREYGPDWRTVASYLHNVAAPGEVILVHPSMMAQPLLYYGIPPDRMNPVDRLTSEELSGLVEGRPRVFLVTPPHHPFVAQMGLQKELDGLLTRQKASVLRPYLPSGWILVVEYGPREGR